MKKLTVFISACLLTILGFPQNSANIKSYRSVTCKGVSRKDASAKKPHLYSQYKRGDVGKSRREMDRQSTAFESAKYTDITKPKKGNKIASK